MAKTPCSQSRGPKLDPGQGTRSCKPKLKIPHATTKTQHSYINKYFPKKETTNKTTYAERKFEHGLFVCYKSRGFS